MFRRLGLPPRTVALAALSLAGLLVSSCGDDPPLGTNNGTCGHIDFAGGVDLVSHGNTVYHQFGSMTQGSITVQPGGVLHGIKATFLDANGQGIPIADDCDIMRIELEVGNTNIADVSRDPGRLWYFNVDGKAVGTTTLRVELWHSTHRHFQSEPITIHVNP